MDSSKEPVKRLDKKTAKARLEQYCAYQERSQQEVREKLYSYGLYPSEVEDLICNLIEANYLNEERFAIAYTLGKFRIKHWGRIKIKQGLKQKRVGDNLIKKALGQIDAEEYERALMGVLKKKDALSKESNAFTRRQKLIQYAISRGYETDLVIDCLNSSGLI
ncbi:regulatory protein RecX [Paradesertivirga mongoliensis]|uniref:Regulatory protein RecX n=1 Tax=Paradesertivirga mongoliensis TaxID=2100740 RepID=A0ABW4ZQK6_9SPHI|nr:RecX family transcriptional regulator [Pedobacter mongoliensis]